MPITLGRTLFLDPEENPTVVDLYGFLCQDLKNALSNLLGLPDDSEKLVDWPNARWSNAIGSVTVESSEWKADPDLDEHEARLLKVELMRHCIDYDWSIEIWLGQIRESEVVLAQECSLSSYQPSPPLETLPELLAFLSEYACKDEDGMRANRTYVVSSDKVEVFTDFIRSSDRRLPIVLISPIRDGTGYLLLDTGSMMCRAQGMAHVIKLEDHSASEQLRSLYPRHACYNGAIRIFWPGFKEADDRNLHPVWLPPRLRAVSRESDICDEIVAEIAEQSPRIFIRNTDIERLEGQQASVRAERQRAKLEERLEEQIRSRSKEDSESAKWVEAYEKLESERDRLEERNRILESNLSTRDHEIRRLTWERTTAWQQVKQRSAPLDDLDAVPRVLLSSKAYRQYRSFDDNQQRYWDERVLGKLLDEQLLGNLSASIAGPSGSCGFYPRSGGAGGRRIAYYIENDQVHVCELFLSGEHDKEYKRLRDQEIDREAYDGFEPWHPREAVESNEN